MTGHSMAARRGLLSRSREMSTMAVAIRTGLRAMWKPPTKPWPMPRLRSSRRDRFRFRDLPLFLGGSDDLSEHYSDGGEEHESPIIGEELVVSGGDAPELLQLVEETLDEVAFFVEHLVVFDRRAAI